MDNVSEPAQQLTEHPPWCLFMICTAHQGGCHVSRVRLVPMRAQEPTRLLQVDLAQPADGEPEVRITDDNQHVLRLSLASARQLGTVLRDLAVIGRRAES